MCDRFEGYGVPRAFACVIRGGVEGRSELLVFDHPEAGTQIPKGRLDPGESHRDAAIRELAEESGLNLEPTRFIAAFEYEFLHPYTGETVQEDGYVWLFEASTEVDEAWTHEPEEEALPFSYRWIPLDERTAGQVHPHFGKVIELLTESTGDDSTAPQEVAEDATACRTDTATCSPEQMFGEIGAAD